MPVAFGVSSESYPGAVEKRYQTREDGKPSEVLERIAQVRGCVQKGGGPDFERAAFDGDR